MYIAAVKFDQNDEPSEMGTSKRSFCTECSSMLWNYHDEWPQVCAIRNQSLMPSTTPFQLACQLRVY